MAKPSVVTITRALDFSNLRPVRQRLLEAIREHSDVVVDVQAVATFDLAGVQLLYACERSCREQGLLFNVKAGSLRSRLEKMAHFAGLPPLPYTAETELPHGNA